MVAHYGKAEKGEEQYKNESGGQRMATQMSNLNYPFQWVGLSIKIMVHSDDGLDNRAAADTPTHGE
jgi:hypothetical protein